MAVDELEERPSRRPWVTPVGTRMRDTGENLVGGGRRSELDVPGAADQLIGTGPADQCVEAEPAVLAGRGAAGLESVAAAVSAIERDRGDRHARVDRDVVVRLRTINDDPIEAGDGLQGVDGAVDLDLNEVVATRCSGIVPLRPR